MELVGIIGAFAAVFLIGVFTIFGSIALSRGHGFSMGAFGANFTYQGA